MYYTEKHLEHHGILGQKWGIRKKKDTPSAGNYSGKQRIYDRKIYGKGSEKELIKKKACGRRY